MTCFCEYRITLCAIVLSLCLTAFQPPAAAAERRENLYLGNSEHLAAAGIKLRTFRDFKSQPLAALDSAILVNSATKETIKVYGPLDLWRQEQTEALFQGTPGRLLVGQLNVPVPTDLPLLMEKYVRREDYETFRAQAKCDWAAADVRTWVEAFTNATVTQTTAKVEGLSVPFGCTRFTLKQAKGEGQAYVLSIRRNAEQQQRLLLWFDFAGGEEVRNLDQAALTLIKAITVVAPEVTAKTADSKFQNRKVNHGVDAANPELQDARKRVIQNIRNLKDWWFVETPNYVIASNLDQGSRKLVDMIQCDSELMRDAYEKAIPAVRPITEVSVVKVFNRREAYQAYVPANSQWSGGLWMPGRDELVISPMDVGVKNTTGRHHLLSVVYHEAFHQYLFYALNRAPVPVWINEGHACLFGGTAIDPNRKRVTLNEDDDMARVLGELLKRDGGKGAKISDCLALDHPQFYAGRIEDHYAMAWALVYFLRKAAFLYPGRNYETVCPTLFKAAAEQAPGAGGGAAGDAALNQAAFAQVDMARLQRDFLEFWGSTTKRGRAERYDPFFDKKPIP